MKNSNNSNSLVHTITTSDKDGNDLVIKIRLNDECKNGHQDFAITADGYKKGSRGDSAFLYGGCCHDEILAVRPDLQVFVDLHLCDYLGTPMYPIANGYFHLTNGANDKPMTAQEFCKYYRITAAQYTELSKAMDKVHYSIILESMPLIRKNWQFQADAAIVLLERWTGKQFLIDSTRTQWDGATDEEKQIFNTRLKEGYYTHEAEQQRKIDAINKKANDIRQAAQAKANKEIFEANQRIAVLLHIGEVVLDNIIIYNHDKTVSFNWKSYGRQFTPEEIAENWEKITALPEFDGYTLKPYRK